MSGFTVLSRTAGISAVLAEAGFHVAVAGLVLALVWGQGETAPTAPTPPMISPPRILPPTAKRPPIPVPAPPSPRRLIIPVDAVGQCNIGGSVNGRDGFTFLADSGASRLSFFRDDAWHLGLDVDRLVFGTSISTANGIGRAARIRLREVRIAGTVFRDVEALVLDKGDGNPLLPAWMLSRLHFQLIGGNCVLDREAQ